ncbi:MAG: hypothetical protein K6B52_02240 [Clostridiales bacterium]|nr:hypothetical protein [Clostridiales bacterium]
MKKLISIVCCVMMIMAITLTGFADGAVNNRVYAEQISGVAGDEISVPVKISGNKGFMGFGLTVSYDGSVLTPVSVAPAKTLPGIFNDSIETADAGSFKVIFTSTENFTSDGELFTLVFNAADDAVGQTFVRLSYDQDDTFNEEFHDMLFDCEPITVLFPAEEPSVIRPSAVIQKWAAGLRYPFNKVMSFLVKPIVLVLSLFGR